MSVTLYVKNAPTNAKSWVASSNPGSGSHAGTIVVPPVTYPLTTGLAFAEEDIIDISGFSVVVKVYTYTEAAGADTSTTVGLMKSQAVIFAADKSYTFDWTTEEFSEGTPSGSTGFGDISGMMETMIPMMMVMMMMKMMSGAMGGMDGSSRPPAYPQAYGQAYGQGYSQYPMPQPQQRSPIYMTSAQYEAYKASRNPAPYSPAPYSPAQIGMTEAQYEASKRLALPQGRSGSDDDDRKSPIIIVQS